MPAESGKGDIHILLFDRSLTSGNFRSRHDPLALSTKLQSLRTNVTRGRARKK